jgi:dolichol-phosphate mannosyltransferase
VIFIAIPAYNEGLNIGLLLDRILTCWQAPGPYRVLLLDDGSSDDTVAVAEDFAGRLPLTIIRHRQNAGVGQAFRTIFQTAMEIGGASDVLVIMEADNTSDLGILNDLIGHAESGYDLALASCYMPGGEIVGTNALRMMLSESANLLLRLAFPIGVHTYSSFYRAYRLDALRRADRAYAGRLVEEAGFVCAVEALVKMRRLGMRVVEVPMVLRTDARKGSSKMRVLRTIYRYLHFIARDRLLPHWEPAPRPAPVDIREV